MTERCLSLSLEERAGLAAKEVGRLATFFHKSSDYQKQGDWEVDELDAGLALTILPDEIVVELKDPVRIVTFKDEEYLKDGQLAMRTVAEVSYGSRGRRYEGSTFFFDGENLHSPRDTNPTARRQRQVLASIITAREVIGELSGAERSPVNS